MSHSILCFILISLLSKLFLVPLKWLSHSMWNILRLEEHPRRTIWFSETENWIIMSQLRSVAEKIVLFQLTVIIFRKASLKSRALITYLILWTSLLWVAPHACFRIKCWNIKLNFILVFSYNELFFAGSFTIALTSKLKKNHGYLRYGSVKCSSGSKITWQLKIIEDIQDRSSLMGHAKSQQITNSLRSAETLFSLLLITWKWE